MNHNLLIDKFKIFHANNKIPHILLFGDVGSGKKYLLNYFLDIIYEKSEKRDYIIEINCSQFKGIKFIREDLKFFGKKQIQNKDIFKSVILYNAEHLTIDAQSSLRRLIELYSKTTRFFLLTCNKNKLILPIISRFCSFYVINQNNKKQLYYKKPNKTKLDSILNGFENFNTYMLLKASKSIYNNCYFINEIIEYFGKNNIYNVSDIELKKKINNIKFKIEYLCREIKNDEFIILYLLYYFRFNLEISI